MGYIFREIIIINVYNKSLRQNPMNWTSLQLFPAAPPPPHPKKKVANSFIFNILVRQLRTKIMNQFQIIKKYCNQI
jgi:hypothetical protein